MKAFFAGLMALLFASAVVASPLPYINVPLDTINQGLNTVVGNINTTSPLNQYLSTCTGTTAATCTGLRFNVSYTGLTTALNTLSAVQTVTDTSVTAASQILCQVNGYVGTGNPSTVFIVSAAGSFTYQVFNGAGNGSLSATVTSSCIILN